MSFRVKQGITVRSCLSFRGCVEDGGERRKEKESGKGGEDVVEWRKQDRLKLAGTGKFYGVRNWH